MNPQIARARELAECEDATLAGLARLELKLIARNRSARSDRNRAERAGQELEFVRLLGRADALAEAGKLVTNLRLELEGQR